MNSKRLMILALNLGSSTIKAAHYHQEGNSLIPHGERLDIPVRTEDQGQISEVLLLERVAVLLPKDALFPDVIAHRILHGGSRLTPALLTDELIVELSTFAPLAPLHQTAALALVAAALLSLFSAVVLRKLDPKKKRRLLAFAFFAGFVLSAANVFRDGTALALLIRERVGERSFADTPRRKETL